MKNKKILFLVNFDSFFISHRLPIAKEAIKKGYEVHLACQFTKSQDYIESLGIKTHSLEIGITNNIALELSKISILRNLLINVSPDILHSITIKPIIYSGILLKTFKNKIKFISAISGLGSMFIGDSLSSHLRKFFFTLAYRLAFNNKVHVIFQNNDDKIFFIRKKILKNFQCHLIKGSGVDLNKFHYEVESISSIKVIFLGRLLKDKGITEFIDSARLTRNIHPEIKFFVVGDSDYNNPSSISNEQILSWKDEGIVEFLGYKKNINEILRKANIVVLPSYREGLPKVLIEAASTGRSVVTTNVPGCRDAIINNKTGLLVPVKDSEALHKAIVRLALNNDLRLKFGKNGREFAEMEFSIDDVVRKHFHLYENV